MSENLSASFREKLVYLFKNTITAIIIFPVFIFVLVAIGCVRHAEGESHLWITLLFGVPCALQMTGLCVLRNKTTLAFWWFNWWSTFVCQASYLLLWIIYSTSWKTHQVFSYVALFLVFVVLGFVTRMTFAIMGKRDQFELKESKDENPDPPVPDGIGTEEKHPTGLPPRTFSQNISAGVGDHPFWAIMFFMALFLGVAYLFGFSLAFHDKNVLQRTENGKPALHMTFLKSSDDIDLPSASNAAVNDGDTPQTSEYANANSTPLKSDLNGISPGEESEEFGFYFEEVRANLLYRSKEDCVSKPKRIDSHLPRDRFNQCSLKHITRTLRKKTDMGQRVRVVLIGHTDNEPIRVPTSTSVRYLSNYELSDARAHNVQYEILQMLRLEQARKLENIEWVIFPAADEALLQLNRGAIKQESFRPDELNALGVTPSTGREEFLEKIASSTFSIEDIDRKLPKEQKRVVIATLETIPESPIVLDPAQLLTLTVQQREALIKLNTLATTQSESIAQTRAKELRLMDYLYFSIYTITTTGYGDIVPTTAYAKFITSIANIFEVIFLVVFFNALLSLKKNSIDDPPTAKGTSQHSHGGPKALNYGHRGPTRVETGTKSATKGRLS